MEKGVNRKGGGTDPNFLSLVVPRLSVCADAQKVDRSKLAQTEVRYLKQIKTNSNFKNTMRTNFSFVQTKN